MSGIVGRRVDAQATNDAGHTIPWLEPGDYGKDFDGTWHCRPPWKHASGWLKGHFVTEHQDGTITVSPSIKITCCLKDGDEVWHGFLEKGIWMEC